MELAPILIAIFAFVIIKNHMEQRAKERARRLQVLEEAIKSGNVDRNTIEDLAATLSGGKPTPKRPDGTPRPRGTSRVTYRSSTRSPRRSRASAT